MQHTFYKLHSSAVAESNELNITLENSQQQQQQQQHTPHLHLQQLQQQHEASPPLANHYEFVVDGGITSAFPPYPATIQVRKCVTVTQSCVIFSV